MDDLERILAAAEKHGMAGDPDMEVGDLQQLARDLWKILTPDQRKMFVNYSQLGSTTVDWHEFLQQWE